MIFAEFSEFTSLKNQKIAYEKCAAFSLAWLEKNLKESEQIKVSSYDEFIQLIHDFGQKEVCAVCLKSAEVRHFQWYLF